MINHSMTLFYDKYKPMKPLPTAVIPLDEVAIVKGGKCFRKVLFPPPRHGKDVCHEGECIALQSAEVIRVGEQHYIKKLRKFSEFPRIVRKALVELFGDAE